MLAIATVILNWNNADSTIICARSALAAMTRLGASYDLQLYVVDNGSNKQNLDKLAHWCGRQPLNLVKFVANESNLGFARGMNSGIARASAQNPDFFLLLNNDLRIDSEAILRLVEHSKNDHRRSMTGLTVLDYKTGSAQSVRGYRYYPLLGYSKPLKGSADLNKTIATHQKEPDYIDGAAIWLKGDFLRRTGGLPAEHFLYFEELELQRRLLPGEESSVCTDAIVFHAGAGSSKTPELQLRTTYHAAFSAFNYTWRYHRWFIATVILARILGISLLAARQGQPKLLWAVLCATKDFFRQTDAIWP